MCKMESYFVDLKNQNFQIAAANTTLVISGVIVIGFLFWVKGAPQITWTNYCWIPVVAVILFYAGLTLLLKNIFNEDSVALK